MTEKKQKKSNGVWWFLLIVLIGIVVTILVVVPEKEITCYRKVLKTERVPYSNTETYQETIASKNCDRLSGCSCLHYSWAGLGACDSCSCRKTRTVTKYKNIEREVEEPYPKQVNWMYGKC